jgi:hypothetical protein
MLIGYCFLCVYGCVAWPALVKMKAILSPKSDVSIVLPNEGNLHYIQALEDTALFDLIGPPYNEDRTCTYYRELNPSPLPNFLSSFPTTSTSAPHSSAETDLSIHLRQPRSISATNPVSTVPDKVPSLVANEKWRSDGVNPLSGSFLTHNDLLGASESIRPPYDNVVSSISIGNSDSYVDDGELLSDTTGQYNQNLVPMLTGGDTYPPPSSQPMSSLSTCNASAGERQAETWLVVYDPHFFCDHQHYTGEKVVEST